MPQQPQWSFLVSHSGRGGSLLGTAGDASARFEIELVQGGAFAVHVQGRCLQGRGANPRALRAAEREVLTAQLRAWLDTTDRATWSIVSRARR